MAESVTAAKLNPIHLSTFPGMYFVKHGLFAKFISGFGPWKNYQHYSKTRPSMYSV
jgi:hypothetical protein